MSGFTLKSVSLARGKPAVFMATAAALAAAALLVRHKAAQAEAEHPPHGQFLEIDGVKLHYYEKGSGDPIVLLHGNGSLIQDFALAGIIDALAEHHRVIAFDRPGFGYTSRPAGRLWNADAQAALIHAALVELDVKAPVVVGHSWGTMVATAMGLAFPDSVRRLVLIAGYYYPTPRLDVPLMSIPAIPVIGTLMRNTLSPLIARLTWPLLSKQLFAPAKVTGSFKRWPVWMTLRPSQLRASAADTAMMVPQAFHMSDRYAELKMPVSVLAGGGDLIVDPEVQSRRLHEAISHSELEVIPGAGHMLHHIAPQKVIAAILGRDDMRIDDLSQARMLSGSANGTAAPR